VHQQCVEAIWKDMGAADASASAVLVIGYCRCALSCSQAVPGKSIDNAVGDSHMVRKGARNETMSKSKNKIIS
jgi:hypothetical protein